MSSTRKSRAGVDVADVFIVIQGGVSSLDPNSLTPKAESARD